MKLTHLDTEISKSHGEILYSDYSVTLIRRYVMPKEAVVLSSPESGRVYSLTILEGFGTLELTPMSGYITQIELKPGRVLNSEDYKLIKRLRVIANTDRGISFTETLVRYTA